jgi:hypothetical protein
MDTTRSKVVAQTHTLSKALLFSYQVHMDTLRHTRIAILGFMTHYLVETPLQSESYLYISRLVKTRDLHPGLLQFAFAFLFFQVRSPSFRLLIQESSSLSPLLFIFLFQSLSVSTQVTCCSAIIFVQVGRTLSKALH